MSQWHEESYYTTDVRKFVGQQQKCTEDNQGKERKTKNDTS